MYDTFSFDGVKSTDLGIAIVQINGADEPPYPIFGGQSIVEQKAISKDHSEIVSTTKQNIQFELTFGLVSPECISDLDPILNEDEFFKDRLYKIGKAFLKSTPIEFINDADDTKVLYILPTSDINIVGYGMEVFTYKVSFQATTPYWLTKKDTRFVNSGETITINNLSNIQNVHGNYNNYPYIKLIGSGNFGIVNTSTGKSTLFTNVVGLQTVDMLNKQIATVSGYNIFPRWNKQPFYSTVGENILVVNNCSVEITTQFPMAGTLG